MGKFIDLTGKRFGKLIVVSYFRKNKYGSSEWNCICDCGGKKTVVVQSLKNGTTKSCGCLKKENHVKSTNIRVGVNHGMTGTKIYRTWQGMKQRCKKENKHRRKHYFDKGIKVCEDWQNDFLAFYNWAMCNGYKEHLTLDRINVNGNYEPSNCRWATYVEQENNRSSNHILKYKEEEKTIAEWAKIIGMSSDTLRKRINEYGWSVEKAIETKTRKWRSL